jgi:FKBP-type peptidyl-prolyl cis-trans isomerase
MKSINILFLCAAVLIISSCGKSSSKAGGPDTLPPIATPGMPDQAPQPQTVTIPGEKPTPGKHGDTTVTASGLMYIDTKVGKGAPAKMGSKLSVNYTGMLTDGSKFDSNVDPDFKHVEPFPIEIGKSSVIAGWTEGLQGMKAGGKRRLIIPSDLGYGPAGSPPKIPGNATLIFDVETVKVD